MLAPAQRPARHLSSLITRHVSGDTCQGDEETRVATWHAVIAEIAVADNPAASECYLHIGSTFVIQQSITTRCVLLLSRPTRHCETED